MNSGLIPGKEALLTFQSGKASHGWGYRSALLTDTFHMVDCTQSSREVIIKMHTELRNERMRRGRQ